MTDKSENASNQLDYTFKIKSFVIRSGRITRAQQRALDELLPKYGNSAEIIELVKEIDSEKKEVNLEIGSGDGENLVHMAKQSPDKIFLGCDVYLPGIGSLLNRLKSENLNNVRVLVGDINEQLHLFELAFQNIYIFFPDPWPKKRHEKRRLINGKFLTFIAKKLKKNGRVYIATDSENYATSILDAIEASEFFINSAGSRKLNARPAWRALTKFEKKALSNFSKIYEISGIYQNYNLVDEL